MPSSAQSPSDRKSRHAVRTGAGCLAYMLCWLTLPWAEGVIRRNLGWPYVVAFYLLVFLVLTLIRVRQIHRRGQTVSEAWASGLAERRLRADRRERARKAAAELPWLNDKRLSPADQSGVLITPAPDALEYFRSGYDIVLDQAGDLKIQVIRQVRKLTRLPLKEAKDLVDGAPVTVLRVPEQPMACAAKSVLESPGATVSITDPAS